MFIFNKRQARSGRNAVRTRPRLEPLEGRVVLSTFKVNTTLDTVAVSSGQLSLRSAIMAANARPNSDTIILPAGTFTLTMGELDIHANLTIKGKGAGATIIDGNSLDRVIEIDSGKVTISKFDDPAWPGDGRWWGWRDPELRGERHALVGDCLP